MNNKISFDTTTRSQYKEHEKWDAAAKIQAPIKKIQAQKYLQDLKTEAVKTKLKNKTEEHAQGFSVSKNKNTQVVQNKDLLKQAFLDERPAVVAWLIQKGESLEELETFTKSILMTREKTDLLNWLKTLLKPKAPTPDNIDHFALDLGLGYKSANLMIMQQKTELISQKLKTATVKVPPFLPVGDFEMTQHLERHLPQVFTKWQKFLDTFDPATKKAFLEVDSNEKASKARLKITKEGKAVLEEIKKEITDRFKSHSYDSPQIDAWLATVKPQFLIVRSTGKEDSDTNSNAGGNASIPYVKPDAKSISIAIGEVIASYFGEKSITQRILYGDRSLFTDKKPFVPVLMQEMVGENIGGHGSKNEDIPRSGVLFTGQSDKAEGVTFIQAGLGNNEGVVTSQVLVDSYFVKDGKIHAVVRNKGTRFISTQDPDGKMTVVPIKNNNPALAKSQALPPSVILDIKRVADEISAAYARKVGSKPMDMEYTVKLKEKGFDKPVIYLLQARPLLNTKGEKEGGPSYLDLNELEPQQEKFSSEVLLDGNAYVRTITDPGSVIFAEDLPKGANAYLHADDPANKKVIIIKKTATATSHESVVLRPKGMAVVVARDPRQFTSLKKIVRGSSQEKPFLVDTQRGILVSCSSKEAPGKMIKKGLVSYPIPLEVTIPPSQIMHEYHQFAGKNDATVKALIANFDKEAEDFINKLQGRKELLAEYDARELLDMMATKEQKEAKLALATLLKRLKNRLVMSMKETEGFRANMNQPMFQVFEAALGLAQKEIVPALEKYPAQSLERLYSIKFLDAMIHQEIKEDVMGNFSYYQALATDFIQKKTMEAASKNGITYSGPNGLKLIYLHQLASQSYSEACNKNWLQFVEDLAKMDPPQAGEFIERLLPLVSQAADLNIIDKWMNTSFNTVWTWQCGEDDRLLYCQDLVTKPGCELLAKATIELFCKIDPKFALSYQKMVTKTALSNRDPKGVELQRAEAVIAELEQVCENNKKTFEWIKEKVGALAIYKQGTANWADPGYAKKQSANLRKAFTTDLGFAKDESLNAIGTIYNNSGAFGKLALLQYVRDAFTIYDGIIKSTKESDKFSSDQEKAEQVADLLEGYLEMMEATFQLVPVIVQSRIMSDTDYRNFEYYVITMKHGSRHEHGFEKLVKKLRKKKLNASEQLEARPEFAVDSTIIGSKVRTSMLTRTLFPNRLEEYFTTFHQNMEQVIKYLNTENGLNADLLSQAAKDLCRKTSRAFTQDISCLDFDSGTVNVCYQIPLRAHAASFFISYDPKNPEKGLDLKVQMFGNDESRRWDWGAAFGSILAYSLASGFVENTPPQIDYKNPQGVTFTLKIPADFKEGEKLIDTIYWITKVMTMNLGTQPFELLEYMQNGDPRNYDGLGQIDWGNLDPECYKYTLHINRTLINQLVASGQKEAVAKVAINSMRGLAFYGIQDYDRDGGSLLLTALQQLKKLIATESSIRAEIQKLIDEPDVERIQGVVSELKAELIKVQ